MRWWNLGFFTAATAAGVEGAVLARHAANLPESVGVVAMAILAMGPVGGVVGVVLGLILGRNRRGEEWASVVIVLGVSLAYYLYWVVWPLRSSALTAAGLSAAFLAYAGLWWWWRAALPRLLCRQPGVLCALSVGVMGASVAGLLFAAAPRLEARGAGPSDRRNLIVIVVDTLRADRLGCYQNPNGLTPNIDRLGHSGVIFSNAYSQMPYTVASMGSFFTSLYPYDLGASSLAYRVNEERTTLAEILREHGFQTAAFVSGFPLKSHVSGLAQGFDYYDEDLWALDAAVGPLDGYFYKLTAARYGLRLVGGQGIALQRTGAKVNEAVFSWFRRRFDRSRPLFLWVHYFDPHLGYDPPPRFRPRAGSSSKIDGTIETVRKIWAGVIKPEPVDIERMIALYDGEVAYVDSEVGRLLHYLEEIGVLSNSLVVFTADHGENLWEHRYPFVHGDLAYNSTVRVPLIMKGLKGVEPRVADTVVELVDVIPTVLADLGIPAGAQMVGESLAPLMRPGAERPFRVALGQAVGKTDPRRGENDDPEVYRFYAATERWKVIRSEDGGTEVYDLASDPGETQPLPAPALPVGQLLDAIGAYSTRALAHDATRPAVGRDVLERLRSLGYVK